MSRQRNQPAGRRPSLGALRRGFRHAVSPLGARHSRRGCRAASAQEEFVRVGDTGHRRPASLRLLGYAGLFAYDMNGTPVWSKLMRRAENAHRLGPGASPALHDGRIYIVNDNEEHRYRGVRRPHRQRALAQSIARRRAQLVDAVRLAERSAHGDRHDRLEKACARTISTARCCGNSPGMTSMHAVDAVCAAHGLLYRELRLLPRPEAADLRDPPGCVRRHPLESRGAQQQIHRLVAADAGAGVSVADRCSAISFTR